MLTNALTGAALDWAVAKSEGATDFFFDTVATHWVKLNGQDRALRFGWAQSYLPSTDWAIGGPIIERARIEIHNATGGSKDWVAHAEFQVYAFGPTPLIAAMRCFVASKLGDEVEAPKGLT